jgi:predicted RNase H-like HicB family nuclease
MVNIIQRIYNKGLNCIKSWIIMKHKFTASIEKDKETGLYIGFIPNLPGAHTQAATLDELYINLREVAELCLEEFTDDELNQLPEFIGFQQVSVGGE